MKVKYDGPRSSIGVAGFGEHKKGETKDYPDDIAEELIENSVRQKFKRASSGGEKGEITRSKNPEELTVSGLKKLLDGLKITFPADAVKADLLKLLKDNTAAPPEE